VHDCRAGRTTKEALEMMKTVLRWRLQFLVLISLAIGASSHAQTQQQPPQAQQAAQAPAQRAAEHTLGAGDVIRVNVFQNPDLTLETRISEQGSINFPLIGNVAVAGLPIGGAEQRIAKALRDGKFVLNPQVSIMLLQVRSAQISILGQVGKPGRYPIDQANAKVSEMIAAAGGAVPGASDVVTLVGQRNGRSVKLDIDLPAVLQGGKSELDPVVANGDIIYVDRAPVYYVYGEVQHPGMQRVERGMTVMQALAQSGGLTQRGTERGMRIHRRDANGAVHVVQPAMNDLVQRDDVIYVKESVF
jgi:polysaccharide export outer membrane protein